MCKCDLHIFAYAFSAFYRSTIFAYPICKFSTFPQLQLCGKLKWCANVQTPDIYFENPITIFSYCCSVISLDTTLNGRKQRNISPISSDR